MRCRCATPVIAWRSMASFIGAPISCDSASAMSWLALVVFGEDRAQQILPLLRRGAGKGREGGARGGDGAVHVLGAADRDLGEGFLGGGVDDIEQLRFQRVDPGAVHIVLPFMLHAVILLTGLVPEASCVI